MESAEQRKQTNVAGEPRLRKAWRWTIWSVILGAAVMAMVFQILVSRAGPILKGRVIETLSTRFDSHVELDNLRVSVISGLNVTGGGLRIFPPDDVVAAGAKSPLVAIDSFEFRASLIGLMFKPMHVGTVHVRGLAISVPPSSMRRQTAPRTRHGGKTKIEVDEFICDDSQLVIGTDKPDKDPKLFELKHIVLHDVGPNAPWPFDALLTNAIPRGDIHATGTFGPWNTESPGDSSVNGTYIFQNADLNTIKGIGGMLHSKGSFGGQLDRIRVEGTTETPDFSLDTANHPVPLSTKFSAIVDGTTGDTYLNAIDARLGWSAFSCRGAVINVKAKGHTIDLDIDVPGGRIEDFLTLAVKTKPAVMTGILETKTRLHISPGKESVTRKLEMKGSFFLRQIHFTNPAVEDKVDMLSLRAEGHPKEARPGAADVRSEMTGQFEMSGGKLKFGDLDYALPGATVKLAGVYSLDGKQFEFTGKVRTEAKLSQMVASRWKSLLLKPVDPFFHKHGAGAEIPVKVSGTEGAPHFGLDLHDHKND